MAWTVPNLFVAGTALAAAELNKIRDSLKAIGDPWTSYTPSWTAATTNPTIGNGTISGGYVLAGKTVFLRVIVTAGSTTNFGSGAYSLSLPVAPKAYPLIIPGGGFVSTSVNSFPIWGICTSGSTMALVADPLTAGASWRAVTSTVPTTWASGNSFSFVGNYEAA